MARISAAIFSLPFVFRFLVNAESLGMGLILNWPKCALDVLRVALNARCERKETVKRKFTIRRKKRIQKRVKPKGRQRIARRKRGNVLPFKKPNTARQYFSLSRKNQDAWDSIGHVISKIRAGMTLPKAAKEFGLSSKTAISLGHSALRKRKNGRYVAKKEDQLLRIVNALTTEGRKEIATRDSRQASLVGSHWAAVQKFLQTGDDSALLRFAKKRIVDARGKRYRLLTDLKELERLASAGVLTFESMYAGGAR
jgi:hypothetical protein